MQDNMQAVYGECTRIFISESRTQACLK